MWMSPFQPPSNCIAAAALAATVSCGIRPAVASAATIPIANNSFENGVGYGAPSDGPSSDWAPSGSYFSSGGATVQGVDVVAATTIGASGSFTGNNVLSMGVNSQFEPTANGTPSLADGYGGIGTDSLGTYTANTTYTLTAALGGDGSADWANVIGLSAGFAGYASIANQVGNTTVNSGTLNHNFVNYSYTVDTATDPSIVGEDIGAFLAVESLVGSTYAHSEFFDNFVLTAASDPTPEPAALSAMLVIGSVGLLRRRAAR
jgi:hypothetical protein